MSSRTARSGGPRKALLAGALHAYRLLLRSCTDHRRRMYLAFQVPISVFPDTNFPRVVIGVDNGVMPVEQMEVTITKPIEDAVNSVPGLVTVRSTTSRGSAEVSLFFDWNVDMYRSLQLTDAALSKVAQTLPSSARITTNRLTFATFPILGYSLTSDTIPQTQLWELATYDLKPPLNRVLGVSTVTVQGGKVPEFHVIPDLALLSSFRRHHLRPGERNPGLEYCRISRPLPGESPADSGPCRSAGARCRRIGAAGGEDHGSGRAGARGRCGHGGVGHHARLHHGDRQWKGCRAAEYCAAAFEQYSCGGRRGGCAKWSSFAGSCRKV